MEGEKEESGEKTQSGTPCNLADAGEESRELQNPQESVGGNRRDSKGCDGAGDPKQKDEHVSETEISPQETVTPADTQDNADCPPQSDEELTPHSVSSHPSKTQKRPPEPCWYCMRSLNPDFQPEPQTQEEPATGTPPPSGGRKMSYQMDPRPHFGVACSSHSPCRPLWGSEGPCWGQRNQDMPNQARSCPHCHLSLAADTLRWHEAKCLLFEGMRNSTTQLNK